MSPPHSPSPRGPRQASPRSSPQQSSSPRSRPLSESLIDRLVTSKKSKKQLADDERLARELQQEHMRREEERLEAEAARIRAEEEERLRQIDEMRAAQQAKIDRRNAVLQRWRRLSSRPR